MIRKILLGIVLLIGLSVQSQTKKPVQSFDTKVKNYVQWIESLPDSKKREEARILVNKLNMMSPSDKGMWLATMEKYSKKEEVKKNVVDSLSNEDVKKKLFVWIKGKVDQSRGEKLDTIVILSSSTFKERTDSINVRLRKEISRFKVVIDESNKKMDSIGGTVNNHYRIRGNVHEMYMDAYYDIANANDKIPRLRSEILVYGVYDSNAWNSYLIDLYKVKIQMSIPHVLTDEELDSGITNKKFDKVSRIYMAQFVRGYDYRRKIRDDKNSEFYIDLVYNH
jgi:hypothetical protein